MKLKDEHPSGEKKYYVVMGMPTPVYAVDEIVTCTFEAFKDKKLVHKVNKDIPVHVKPCALEFVLKSVSSRYISESDVIYELVLKLPVQAQSPLSNLSKQTDVAIKFENFTQDFRDLNINCSVLNGQCSVAGRNYLMIKGLQADGS